MSRATARSRAAPAPRPAVWVACPRCNVIALVIDRTTEAHVCLIGTIFSLLYIGGADAPAQRVKRQHTREPTLASVAPISALLEALEVGELLSHGGLTVIPLLAPKEAEPNWLTLAEAGAAITITVRIPTAATGVNGSEPPCSSPSAPTAMP